MWQINLKLLLQTVLWNLYTLFSCVNKFFTIRKRTESYNICKAQTQTKSILITADCSMQLHLSVHMQIQGNETILENAFQDFH